MNAVTNIISGKSDPIVKNQPLTRKIMPSVCGKMTRMLNNKVLADQDLCVRKSGHDIFVSFSTAILLVSEAFACSDILSEQAKEAARIPNTISFDAGYALRFIKIQANLK